MFSRPLPFMMLLLLFVVVRSTFSTAQDALVRQQAETLLEKADSLATPHEFGAYEQVIIFHSTSAQGSQQGQFTSVVKGPRSYRDEYEFGSYRLLVIVNGDTYADVGDDRAKAPLEVRRMTWLNQPYRPRFDQSDIVRSIQESAVNGRPARCIQFDTVTGEKIAANQICIDSELGVISRVHVNGETIINSDFFVYRDTHIPSHIIYEQGDLHMELEQTKRQYDGPFDPDFLIPPPNSRVAHLCTGFRRAFGQFMPQPKPGTGMQNADVILHGTINTNGTIREPSIDWTGRADLNEEALRIFRTWRFSGAICDGTPIEVPVDVTLHFQRR
jgi:hypothetical protein